ncbi:MAG: hypothetical protein EXS05_15410 [Planctomycetaceae bacterium]|nr:hypothetical protein [Planctomycetaceae bacterium]
MQVAHFLRTFGLPLLGKELIEQAARRRTYIIRVLYAVILCFASYLVFYDTMHAASVSPLAVLGRGHEIFMGLVYLQFAGIYLFMPAMTCGVLTQEKERASLQLLFLTRLGPWTILFEKLLGRLVPMLAFLLLALPLSALAYTLGGISPDLLWTGVWLLVLAAIQMGTLALACSAFFRTTVAAFVASYVIAFLMFFGPYFLWLLLYLVTVLLEIDVTQLFAAGSINTSPAFLAIGAFPFFSPAFAMMSSAMPGGLGGWPLAVHSAIILSTSGVCLGLARYFIVRRAFLPPRNVLLEFFKILDRGVRRPREEASGGEGSSGAGTVTAGVAARDEVLLPANDPVAWRETTKRALGRPRYLVRILVIVEFPLVLLCGFMSLSNSQVIGVAVMMMILMLWGLAVLAVSAQSASLIASERSHQTLDVLCTTPLTGREIVLQKIRGVRRLILVLFVPLLTLFLFDTWLAVASPATQPWGEPSRFNPLLYLMCSVLAAAIYLPLVAWLSLAIGLFVRSQARAMIGSMGVIVAWCVAPLVFIVLPLSIVLGPTGMVSDLISYVSLLSPATIVFMNEFQSLKEFPGGPVLPVVFNFIGYLFALNIVRSVCLSHADRWLGRAEQP